MLTSLKLSIGYGISGTSNCSHKYLLSYKWATQRIARLDERFLCIIFFLVSSSLHRDRDRSTKREFIEEVLHDHGMNIFLVWWILVWCFDHDEDEVMRKQERRWCKGIANSLWQGYGTFEYKNGAHEYSSRTYGAYNLWSV